MLNVCDITGEKKTSKLVRSSIRDHLHRTKLIESSESGKTNALLNIINHQADNDKMYLYSIDPYGASYHILINKREKVKYVIYG